MDGPRRAFASSGVDSLAPNTVRRLAIQGRTFTVTVLYRRPKGRAVQSCSAGEDALEQAALNEGRFAVSCDTPIGAAGLRGGPLIETLFAGLRDVVFAAAAASASSRSPTGPSSRPPAAVRCLATIHPGRERSAPQADQRRLLGAGGNPQSAPWWLFAVVLLAASRCSSFRAGWSA